MQRPTLILSTRLSLSDGSVHECQHDLQPIVAAETEASLVQLERLRPAGKAPGSHPFPSGSEIQAEVKLPDSIFLEAHLPSPPNLTWRRSVIFQRGLFLAVWDESACLEGQILRREDSWQLSPSVWRIEDFRQSPAQLPPGQSVQLCLLRALEERKPRVDLAQGRFIRWASLREGGFAGLGDASAFTDIRNIRLKARAFCLDQIGFALLQGTSLSYSGRQILEAEKPVSIELNLETGIGTVEGKADSRLLVHGGNMTHEVQVIPGRTEISITGLARKGDWWNVVMAAVQKL